MRGLFDFIIEPKDQRYNNVKHVNESELILNTELQNHQYVSRQGIVLAEPSVNETNIKKGDTVILHHNVFRRFRDVRGREKNGKSYYSDNVYIVSPDLIFAKVEDNTIKPLPGFNFVKPIKENKMFSIDFEKPLIGVLKYKDANLEVMTVGDLVGFSPGTEYEFLIENEKLYRVPTNQITIKYEYQGDEEEYNPSWAQGS